MYFHQYLFLLLTIFFNLASPSALTPTGPLRIAADLKPFASNETLNGITDGFRQRNPGFKQNLLRGFALAQQIVSSQPLRMLEVRNRPREGATTKLDEFVFIKLYFIGYLGQAAVCTTLSGDKDIWGDWDAVVHFGRDPDEEVLERTFVGDQVTIDEDEAANLLRLAGFTAPWAEIRLCIPELIGALVYIFQEPLESGVFKYDIVGAQDRRIRIWTGAEHPCWFRPELLSTGNGTISSAYRLGNGKTNTTYQTISISQTVPQTSSQASTSQNSRVMSTEYVADAVPEQAAAS